MSGENVKKIESRPSKRIESPGTTVKGTEKLKRKRIQIVGMNGIDYPLYLDGLTQDEEETGEEDLYDSDFAILFREFLYESDFWNLDRRLDSPIPGLWLNEFARGEFYTEPPARRVSQEESSTPVERTPHEKPRPYGANRGRYGIGSEEEAGEGQPENRKVEEAYFDFGSFEIPDFDLWPR